MKRINGNLMLCVFTAFVLAAIVVCASLGNAEDKAFREDYARYKEADSAFLDGKPEEALETYRALTSVFPNAHILEFKAAICELSLKNYESALFYGLKTLEMYPWVAQDSRFLMMMEECYRNIGDDHNAEVIRERSKALE